MFLILDVSMNKMNILCMHHTNAIMMSITSIPWTDCIIYLRDNSLWQISVKVSRLYSGRLSLTNRDSNGVSILEVSLLVA